MILSLRANGARMSNVRLLTPIGPCRIADEQQHPLQSCCP